MSEELDTKLEDAIASFAIAKDAKRTPNYADAEKHENVKYKPKNGSNDHLDRKNYELDDVSEHKENNVQSWIENTLTQANRWFLIGELLSEFFSFLAIILASNNIGLLWIHLTLVLLSKCMDTCSCYMLSQRTSRDRRIQRETRIILIGTILVIFVSWCGNDDFEKIQKLVSLILRETH